MEVNEILNELKTLYHNVSMIECSLKETKQTIYNLELKLAKSQVKEKYNPYSKLNNNSSFYEYILYKQEDLKKVSNEKGIIDNKYIITSIDYNYYQNKSIDFLISNPGYISIAIEINIQPEFFKENPRFYKYSIDDLRKYAHIVNLYYDFSSHSVKCDDYDGYRCINLNENDKKQIEEILLSINAEIYHNMNMIQEYLKLDGNDYDCNMIGYNHFLVTDLQNGDNFDLFIKDNRIYSNGQCLDIHDCIDNMKSAYDNDSEILNNINSFENTFYNKDKPCEIEIDL